MPEGYPSKSGWRIEWDGNTEGLVAVEVESIQFYKISDITPTDDEFIGRFVYSSNGEGFAISSRDIGTMSEDCTAVGINDPALLVIKKDNTEVYGSQFPSKGIYLIKNGDIYVQKITEVITTLDEEFLPTIEYDFVRIPMTHVLYESISTAADALSTANTANNTANTAKTTANTAKTTADTAKTAADTAKTAASNAQTTANAAKQIADKALTIDSYGVISAPIGPMTQRSYQSLLLRSADSERQVKFKIEDRVGLRITVNRDGGSSDSVSNPSTVEFEPNGGAYMQLSGINALIMSPINSTKKFKITVDDSGTLSATEVT